ncbi:MAG: hypothetical protein ACLVJH_00230 [Faecalibacterium prausnitzii]
MTIYISPNPGKTSASEIALRAAQILLTHGAAVLMSDSSARKLQHGRSQFICRWSSVWSVLT